MIVLKKGEFSVGIDLAISVGHPMALGVVRDLGDVIKKYIKQHDVITQMKLSVNGRDTGLEAMVSK